MSSEPTMLWPQGGGPTLDSTGLGADGDAARLVRALTSDDAATVDHLVSMLEAGADAEVERVLASAPIAALDPSGTAAGRGLLDGAASLESLRAAKDAVKADLSGATDEVSHARALLAYFMVTAAALRHHDTPIGARSRADMAPLLLEVATALPDAWLHLFAEAAMGDRGGAGAAGG